MNYKVEKTIKNLRKYLTLYIIIWFFLTILFVAPFAVSVVESEQINGSFSTAIFIEKFIPAVSSFTCILQVFKQEYLSTFVQSELVFSAILVLLIIVGVIKSVPKHQYSDIEHGSSDWSEGGEQYKILNKNKGIILAQDNYLPVDKRGNINVLVVGRIWFW